MLTTVPMWFGVTDEDKSQSDDSELAEPEHQDRLGHADYFEPVVALTAAADITTARSGRCLRDGRRWRNIAITSRFPRTRILRANALLALDGSPGHVTEVLSGDYYQPLSTSSPHQIWSAAMVVSPMLRGLLGLQFDAQTHVLSFAPHIPADWKDFSIQRVAAGGGTVDFHVSRSSDSLTLTAERKGSSEVRLDFRPALSLRADILSATLNGRPVTFKVERHGGDQHVVVEAELTAETNTLHIRSRNDFAITYSGQLPSLGSKSRGLRILSETWSASHDTLTLATEGMAGQTYTLAIFGREQIQSVDGAKLGAGDAIEQSFPQSEGDTGTLQQKVTIHFRPVKK